MLIIILQCLHISLREKANLSQRALDLVGHPLQFPSRTYFLVLLPLGNFATVSGTYLLFPEHTGHAPALGFSHVLLLLL